MGDRQAASGPTTGMSVLRIVTGMTVDEFAAPGAPLLRSTEPIRRAGRASATLAGPAWSCATNGGRFGYGAGGDAARQACSPAFGDVATRAPPGMPADGAYEELVRRSAAAGVRSLAYRPPGWRAAASPTSCARRPLGGPARARLRARHRRRHVARGSLRPL